MLKNHFRTTLVLALAFLALAAAAEASLLRIYYPDIEQGSATLIVSPSGKALLIDAGSGLKATDDDVVELIRDLQDQGVITDMAYTLATHYDEDHIGRMEDVLNFGVMSSTATAYDRGTAGGTPSTFAYDDYSSAAANYSRTTITANTMINLGSGVTVRCYVLNAELPDATTVSLTGTDQQENARSVAVVVSYGDVDVWIGGDLTGNDDTLNFADVESAVAPFTGDVDVYTFNHHGSNSSSAQDFLDVLEAEVGIVQSSTSNNFGHPRADVLQRFLDTPDTDGNDPIIFQQNPGDASDSRSDDSKATHIHDSDDLAADGAFGLPATITLVSDGTSYQIFGGAVAPVKLEADAGLGTLGNYPPAIIEVWRSLLVPTATQTTTVSAEIHDETSFTAEIVYWVDGVLQSPISMSQVGSTDVWEGTIPSQLDGREVVYRVEATDSGSQTSKSFSNGYFSGTTPVATLRQNDSDGLLEPMRYHARVRGNLTVAPGVFHSFVSQIWVQDSAGDGIQIFDGSVLSLSLGDEVEFVGSLEQFAGQTQINISQDWGNFGETFVASGTAPTPTVVTVSQIGESLEGQLVRINGAEVSFGQIFGSGNSNLTITDDGGASEVTLRIDGDTDIPGAPTPTQSFDVIGIVSQYDAGHPFTGGYQILPRSRADFSSAEVNLPDVIIAELHTDPHSSQGDANGDGTVSSSHDEFVEIWNTTYGDVDISGWEIHDGTGLRFTFPANTTLPAREAAVVFGGGTPTGDFGNASANGLVFTSYLGLNNSGDTITLKDDSSTDVQVVTYGSEGGNNESLVRSPDFTNAPFIGHTTADTDDSSRYSPGTTIFGQAFTVAPGSVILTEVMYDPSGSDGGLEWVEICNTTGNPIDLSRLSLGWGGTDYTYGTLTLAGTLPANGVWVIGGETSSADNANPTFDDAIEFSPGLQNSGSTADAVALFNVTSSLVGSTTVPIDAVIYGSSNTNGLLDETGSAGTVDVGDTGSGETIERTSLAGAWQIQSTPTPNTASVCSGGGTGGSEELILTEVFYDASGSDGGLEWVEIKNVGTGSANLSDYSLGWGGSDYTYGTMQLSGTLAAGAVMVVGGTTSNSTNYNPTLDLSQDFSPDIQNGDSPADGLGLFKMQASSITSVSVPEDAVIWGSSNTNGLVDETGMVSSPEVGGSSPGTSIERTTLAGAWQVQSTPTPNSSSI